MPTAKRMVGSVALALSVGVALLATAAFAADIKVEGEDMTRPATGASIATALSDDEGDSLRYTANATANKDVTYSDNSTQVVVRAKAGQSGGSPQLRLLVNNGSTTTTVGTQTVSSDTFTNYTFNYSLAAGAQRNIRLQSLNVATGRNIYVDYFIVVAEDPPAPTLPTRQAEHSDAFVESVGVVSKTNFPNYAEKHESVVLPRLDELGVRHIRGAAVQVSNSAVWGRAQDIAALGIKWNLVVNEKIFASPPSSTTLNALYTNSGSSVEQWEGPNEFNNNHHYVGWGGDLRDYQCRLFGNVKASSNPSILVLAPSIGKTGGAVAQGGEYPPLSEVPDMSDCSDANNSHAYLGGNMPTGSHDSEYDSLWFDRDVPFANHVGAAGRDIYMTETGYTTATDGFQHKVSLEAQKRYVPRLHMECFNAKDSTTEPDANFARCYEYQLLETGSTTGDQSNYGLIEYSGSPKPAFVALENTIDILEDPGPAYSAGSLPMEIVGANASTRSALFQKRDGTFYLALWQEVQSYDKLSDIMNIIAPDSVTVKFETSKPLAVFDVHDITSSGASDDAETHPTRTIRSDSITENVMDTVKIIRVG